MRCCHGRLGLLEYSYSSDIALTLVKTLTPKLRGESGTKPRCDSPVLEESPASLVSWIPAYFVLLEQCKWGRMESRIWSFLLASWAQWLGSMRRGEPSLYPPCIHFGTVAVFEVALSCRKLRGRLRAACLFAMPVCTKNRDQRQSQVLLELGNGTSTKALLNAGICFVEKTWLWVALLLRFLILSEHQD